MSRKITAELEPEVLRKATEGWSAERIAAWLFTAHKVQISGTAIRKRLTQTRTDRADVAKVIVREVLGKSIPEDLARLERLALKAEKLAGDCEHDPALWAKLADQVRKFTETKLHFSGADTPDDSLSSLADAESRLSGRLDRLAEGNGEGPGA